MWFLIKGSFWTTMTLVALSFLSSEPGVEADGKRGVEVSEAFGAASEAYRYISALCTEKPDVCEKGSETFIALQHRAREGAKVAYQIIDRHLADQEASQETAATELQAEDTLTTGAVTVVPVPHAKPVR